MSSPKHSIIVPAYNTGNAIRRCIESIMTQTSTDWELVIVDDGSTDGTSSIMDEYASNDSRIRCIHIPNGGVSNARNVGLQASLGEYVMFVDSDDWIESCYLSQVEASMHDNADMYIVGMTMDHTAPDGNIYYSDVMVAPVYRHITSVQMPHEIGYMLQTVNMDSSCLKSYRRSFLLEHDIHFHTDMIVFEDMYFVLQCLLHRSSISLIPYIGYHYCMALTYNTIGRRGYRDLYPSMSLLFKLLDDVDKTLLPSAYSHKQLIRIMLRNLNLVLLQSRYADSISARKRPFRQIINDAVLQSHVDDLLSLMIARHKLVYKLMRAKLYYLAYLVHKHI